MSNAGDPDLDVASAPPITPHVPAQRHRLARPLDIERNYDPTEYAMVAALRVVLDLPRQLPDRGHGGAR